MESFSERFEKAPISWTLFFAIILGLNLWWDYYHPRGFVIDLVILIVALVKWSRAEYKKHSI